MPTRHGWAALFSSASAFTVGRVFGLIELYVVGAGLATAVVLGLLAVRRGLPDLRVQRVARPATVSVGDPARVDIQVTNVGRRRSPHLQLWEPVGDNGGAPMQLAPLAPGEAASAAYRVPTSRRGLLRTGPLRAQRRDVLGLCVRTTHLAGLDEVLVVPNHTHLPFPSVGSSGRLGQHLRMKAWGQTGGEFHSLREYSPGDDLRRINWKASARGTGLIVRETALEGVRRCTVLFDTDHTQYDSEGFERAVQAAASLTLSAVGAGVGTRLASVDIDLRGPDVAHTALQWLATVEPSDLGLDYAAVGRGAGDGIGLVVLITGSATSAAVTGVRAGLAPDETMVLVLVTELSEPGGFVADGSSLDALFDTWSVLVSGHRARVLS